MKEKVSNYVLQFIKEMIPVIVGILIALSIDNWNQNNKDEKYVKEIYSLINSELKETTQNINENLPLQKSLIDTIDFYSKNKEVNILNIVLKSKGIYIATVKTNAWKALSSSKIELVDYKKIADLSNIDEQKEILKRKSQNLMNFISSNPNETQKDKKEILKIMILDIIGTEKAIQSIIENYEKK